MKDFLLVVFILITICFCIYELVQAIMYSKFLKQQDEQFEQILNSALEQAIKDLEEKEQQTKKTKKVNTRKNNKIKIEEEK